MLIPTLSGYDVTIPVVGTDYATGRSLVDLADGRPFTLRVKVDGFINEDVLTNNVIAETPGGRADRTVVVGGHLDSVYEGPGINDDGSGVSMMLETAEQMHELGISRRNKVRFIFFSGEEQGLLGSDYYVSQLSREIKDISVMLDFDMLASGNYARFIYDGNGDEHGFAGPNGSGAIEQVFKDFWDSQGLAYETIPFDGRSDYDAFTVAGIPAGGIFAGAEVEKSRTRSRSTAAPPARPSTRATTSSATRWRTSASRACDEHKDAAVHAIPRSPRPRPRSTAPTRARRAEVLGLEGRPPGPLSQACRVGLSCAGGPTQNTRRVASGDWLVVEQQTPTQARSRASSIFRAAGAAEPTDGGSNGDRRRWGAAADEVVGRAQLPLAHQWM